MECRVFSSYVSAIHVLTKRKKKLIGAFNIIICANPALGHQPSSPLGQFVAINTLSFVKDKCWSYLGFIASKCHCLFWQTG